MINNLIKEIKVPVLGDNYAETISQNFENIRENFQRFANLDFTKGTPGDTIYIEDIVLKENSEWKNAIKQAILQQYRDEDGANYGNQYIGGVDMFDDFNEDPGRFFPIYADNGVTGKRYVSSLGYTFIDSRFSNKKTTIGIENYKNDYLGNNNEEKQPALDYSCTVYFKRGEEDYPDGRLVAEQNFPVLYYDEEIGFCWKINGNETGISAQGPQGTKGLDGNMFVVKVKYYNEDGSFIDAFDDNYDVVSVMDKVTGTWMKLENTDLKDYTGSPVIAISDTYVPQPKMGFTHQAGQAKYLPYWITYVVKVGESSDGKGIYKAKCTETDEMTSVLDSETFNKVLTYAQYDSSNGLKGLYLPIKKDDNNPNVCNAHMLYAAINGDAYRDLHLAPVQDNSIPNPNEVQTISNANLYIDYDQTYFEGTANFNKRLAATGIVNIENSDTVVTSTNQITLASPLVYVGKGSKMMLDDSRMIAGNINSKGRVNIDKETYDEWYTNAVCMDASYSDSSDIKINNKSHWNRIIGVLNNFINFESLVKFHIYSDTVNRKYFNADMPTLNVKHDIGDTTIVRSGCAYEMTKSDLENPSYRHPDGSLRMPKLIKQYVFNISGTSSCKKSETGPRGLYAYSGKLVYTVCYYDTNLEEHVDKGKMYECLVICSIANDDMSVRDLLTSESITVDADQAGYVTTGSVFKGIKEFDQIEQDMLNADEPVEPDEPDEPDEPVEPDEPQKPITTVKATPIRKRASTAGSCYKVILNSVSTLSALSLVRIEILYNDSVYADTFVSVNSKDTEVTLTSTIYNFDKSKLSFRAAGGAHRVICEINNLTLEEPEFVGATGTTFIVGPTGLSGFTGRTGITSVPGWTSTVPGWNDNGRTFSNNWAELDKYPEVR